MQYGRRGLRHAHESRSASLGVSVVHFHLGGRSDAGHGARGGGGPLQCAPRRTGGPRWRSHTVPSDREGPQRGVRRVGDEPLPKVDRNDWHRPMHVPDTAPHASNPYVGRVEDDAQPPTRRWAPLRAWVLHMHSSSSPAASPSHVWRICRSWVRNESGVVYCDDSMTLGVEVARSQRRTPRGW